MTRPLSDKEVELIIKWGDAFGDEVDLAVELQASRKKLAAVREAAEAVQCDATRKVLRILDGPPRG